VFTVRWKDDRGKAHKQKCDLRERVKRGFKGEVVFVYGTNGKFTVEIVESPQRYPIPQRPQPGASKPPPP
jgi:hypothetical protein